MKKSRVWQEGEEPHTILKVCRSGFQSQLSDVYMLS